MKNKENFLEKRLFYYMILTMLLLLIIFIGFFSTDSIRDYVAEEYLDDSDLQELDLSLQKAWNEREESYTENTEAKLYILGGEEDLAVYIETQLINMKIPYQKKEYLELSDNMDMVIVCQEDLQKEDIAKLESFNLAGGNILFMGYTENTIKDKNMQSLMGIETYLGQEKRRGICFASEVFFGEQENYNADIKVGVVNLLRQTEVYASALEDEKKEVEDFSPLLWRYKKTVNSGNVFVADNVLATDIFGNVVVLLCLQNIYEHFMYPIVNAYCFFIAGMPYDTNFSTKYLKDTYSRDALGIQNDILFPELKRCEERYGLIGTWYSPQKEHVENSENSYINYYVRDIRERNSIIGEQMPDGRMQVDAVIPNSLKEWGYHFDFTNGTEIYLPYKNEIREADSNKWLKNYAHIRSVGFNSVFVDIQYVFDEKEKFDWIAYTKELETLLGTEMKEFYWLDYVSAEKAVKRVANFLVIQPEISYEQDKINISIDNFIGEAFFCLHTQDEIADVKNAQVTEIGKNIYFVKVSKENAVIYLNEE